MDPLVTPAGISLIRLSAQAVVPARANPTDAGLDLSAAVSASVDPGARVSITTGWKVAEIPVGWAALVMARSGLARRHGLTLANSVGLVDAGYRGELIVMLLNLGERVVEIAPGDRIAQLVLVPVGLGPALEVDEAAPSDGRGEAGFGSSGV